MSHLLAAWRCNNQLQVEVVRFVTLIAGLAITTGIIVVTWWAAWLNREHKGFMTTGNMIANAISGTCASALLRAA